MDRLAEDRKGPSSMEHKKRQMIAALETNVKVCLILYLAVSCSFLVQTCHTAIQCR